MRSLGAAWCMYSPMKLNICCSSGDPGGNLEPTLPTKLTNHAFSSGILSAAWSKVALPACVSRVRVRVSVRGGGQQMIRADIQHKVVMRNEEENNDDIKYCYLFITTEEKTAHNSVILTILDGNSFRLLLVLLFTSLILSLKY